MVMIMAADFTGRTAGRGWRPPRRCRCTTSTLLRWRIDRCAAKGFDGVEFDNVAGYQAPTGFHLTAADQLRFNVWLANQPTAPGSRSHSRTTPIRCGLLRPFITASKPVFEVEYGRRARLGGFCAEANALGFESLRKHLELGPWRIACR